MEKKNPIEEARRYLTNAKTILREKAVKDGEYYTDSKYTRMTGNCMWNGCQIALSYALGINPKKGQRLDIKDFKEAARHRSKKLQNDMVEGYNIMHLYMGYDGTKDYKIISSGLEKMENILNWCEANTGALRGTTTRRTRKTTKK